MARQHLVPLILVIELEYKAGRKEVSVREEHRQRLSAGAQNPPPREQPSFPTCETGEKTDEKRTAITWTKTTMSGSAETDGYVQEQYLAAELHCIRSLHETGFLPCSLLKQHFKLISF